MVFLRPCVVLWIAIAAAGARADAPIDHRADFKSQHFLIHTDLSEAMAQEVLGKLETTLAAISDYYRRPSSGVIECYVVADLAHWPSGAFRPDVKRKIAEKAGVTLTEVVRSDDVKVAAKSIVYAFADRGTPQHEAVHAYLGQTFGVAGPVWYAEGMAEMGQYWRPGDASVQCPQWVIKHVQSQQPPRLMELINGVAASGDSWENYSWRWALCHLLAHNSNYSGRFRLLGMNVVSDADVSFEKTFAGQLDRIEFEYRFFVEHLDGGYRVDLCRWNWNRKFQALDPGKMISTKVQAARGWQPSGLLVSAKRQYDYVGQGQWQTEGTGREVTADGGRRGRGRLQGVVLKGYTLSEPFDLGSRGKFAAPADGKLFLRCADDWNELADNQGTVSVFLRPSPR